jgi:hypothetical protein
MPKRKLSSGGDTEPTRRRSARLQKAEEAAISTPTQPEADRDNVKSPAKPTPKVKKGAEKVILAMITRPTIVVMAPHIALSAVPHINLIPLLRANSNKTLRRNPGYQNRLPKRMSQKKMSQATNKNQLKTLSLRARRQTAAKRNRRRRVAPQPRPPAAQKGRETTG